jgi:hypothetical protein
MTDLTRTKIRRGRFPRAIAAACLMLCMVPPGITAPRLLAQSQPPAQRIVQGKVVDKAGAPLKGATVYLKDGHTLEVRSFIAGDDGSFRFGQLAQSTDYQVWAEFPTGGRKSPTKNISSFDARSQFNMTLKIDTSK